jgi:SAM-dependent methyltransferase
VFLGLGLPGFRPRRESRYEHVAMRREALTYLACPNCGTELTITSVDEDAPDGHVIEGALTCVTGTCTFRVRRGVPVLVPGHVEAVKSETAARFAEEWTRWTELHPFYEKQFLGWVAPVTREDFAGRVVFEGGCGKGRHTDLVARFGAKAVVSVDLGESAFVAFENTRQHPNAHVVLGDLTRPPVRPVFDLAFSVGVLHHLPHPEAGARSIASVVRDGGRMVVWVYGQENNEWITRFVDPIRKAITSRIPYRALRTLSAVRPRASGQPSSCFIDRAPTERDRRTSPMVSTFRPCARFPIASSS